MQQLHSVWTIEQVKQGLPAVSISLLGREHGATLSVASPRMATATITAGPRACEQYEFSWETIVASLNDGTPLSPYYGN